MLRAGIIGTNIGLRGYLPALLKTNKVEILSIVGSSYSRSKYFADIYHIPKPALDFYKMCEDPDIDLVCIASPNMAHYSQIIYALENGKHVITESPIALTEVDFARLTETLTGSNSFFVINHQLRYNPFIVATKRLLSDIGRIIHIRIHQNGIKLSHKDINWNWNFDQDQAGGIRLSMIPHLLDLLHYWLNGLDTFSITASLDPVFDHLPTNRGELNPVTVGNFSALQLLTSNNVSAHICALDTSTGNKNFEFSVYGTEGELHYDMYRGLRISKRGSKNTKNEAVIEVTADSQFDFSKSFFGNSFYFFIPLVIDAIIEDKPSLISDATQITDLMLIHRLTDAIILSNQLGTSVRLGNHYLPKVKS